jgi:hypothetical protein
MTEERRARRDRMRSFVLGGVVGASAAIAAARRLGPRPRRRATPAGLLAFEDAPCFQETLEREQAQPQPRSRPSSSDSRRFGSA